MAYKHLMCFHDIESCYNVKMEKMTLIQHTTETENPILNNKNMTSRLVGRRSLLAAALGLAFKNTDAKSKHKAAPMVQEQKIANVEKINGAIERLQIKSGYVTELVVEAGKLKLKKILDTKDESVITPIASLTKLLTILSVYEICDKQKINRKDLIEIHNSEKDNARKSKQKKIKVGQKFSIDKLIEMALINSNNEAVEALARYVGNKLTGNGEGRDKFIKYMNDRAKSLHMHNSKFDSPSGLSAGNTSTPIDINTLVLVVYNSPYPIGSLTVETKGADLGHHIHLRNANAILLEILEYDKDFEALIQKTGYIEESGKCITLMVKNVHNKKIFIMNLFGTARGHKGGSGDPIRRAKVKHILSILRKI